MDRNGSEWSIVGNRDKLQKVQKSTLLLQFRWFTKQKKSKDKNRKCKIKNNVKMPIYGHHVIQNHMVKMWKNRWIDDTTHCIAILYSNSIKHLLPVLFGSFQS